MNVHVLNCATICLYLPSIEVATCCLLVESSSATATAYGLRRKWRREVERRYFSSVHYLALVCDDNELAARWQRRPAWRKSSSSDYIEKHVRFNRWFKDRESEAVPAIELLDTTGVSVEQTAEHLYAGAILKQTGYDFAATRRSPPRQFGPWLRSG